MSKVSFLILALGATTVLSEVFDINDSFDSYLTTINKQIREHEETTSIFPGNNTFIPNISYSKGIAYGADSLVRSGNCTLTLQGSTATYDFHIGWNLYGYLFTKLTIYGEDMSAFLRIHDISQRFTFSVHNATECYVTIDVARWERMRNFEFATSRPEFNDFDVNELFELYVIPELNRQMEATKTDPKAIEYYQQFCHHSPLDNSYITKPFIY